MLQYSLFRHASLLLLVRTFSFEIKKVKFKFFEELFAYLSGMHTKISVYITGRLMYFKNLINAINARVAKRLKLITLYTGIY